MRRFLSKALAITAAYGGLAALTLAMGCATLEPRSGASAMAGSPASRGDVRPASAQTADESPDKGLLSELAPDKLAQTAKKLTGHGPDREAALRLYREGDDLFRQAMGTSPPRQREVFALAAASFVKAAERSPPQSQLAMDSLLMAAESYFFADQYPQANHYYEKLVKEFPNNRYLDQIDKRRFAIAKFWLDWNHQSPEPVFYVNWFDKSRPWRDMRGHALRIFDKIRIDDPTGRLSDDATLAAANEYFASGKFYKADEYYTDLRKAYPSSEHQFLAHFLGIKAKLNSYQGPAYGGTALDEAEKLIKQTRRQFPQEAEREREFLDRAAAEVRYRKAEQLMYLGQFYDRRREYRAAQHYYERVAREYPDTPLAEQAGQRMAQIAGLPPVPPRPLPWLVALFPESDKVKPLLKAATPAPGAPPVATAPSPEEEAPH
jgi:outer membrane protein assembly factor BamD (BamD/ComL family)